MNDELKPFAKSPHLGRFAEKTVEFVGEVCMQLHRGAFHIETGYVAVFGNDGADSDPRSVDEIKLAFDELDRIASVAAFAKGQYSWVMIVDVGGSDIGADDCHNVVCRAWASAVSRAIWIAAKPEKIACVAS